MSQYSDVEYAASKECVKGSLCLSVGYFLSDLTTGLHFNAMYQDKQANPGIKLHHSPIRRPSFFLPATIHTMQRKCVCVCVEGCEAGFEFCRQCELL